MYTPQVIFKTIFIGQYFFGVVTLDHLTELFAFFLENLFSSLSTYLNVILGESKKIRSIVIFYQNIL